MHNLTFPRLKNPWLRLTLPLMAGMLIAATISLWPELQCKVFAQCNARDQWCNGDCSVACQPANSLGYVVPTSCNPAGSYCAQTFNEDACAVRCTDPGTCNVTQLVSGGACAGRLDQRGNYSYWAAGECVEKDLNGNGKIDQRNECIYEADQNDDRVDCCTGAPVEPPPPACTPEYGPPTMAVSSYQPPFPIVIGQDPEQTGVDVTLTLAGGVVTNGCPDGAPNETLTRMVFNYVALSAESAAWIANDLAGRYPGAEVLGEYPFVPDFVLTPSLPASSLSLRFHLAPLDPGYYDLNLTALQADGQETTATLQIPVYLMESTIIQ